MKTLAAPPSNSSTAIPKLVFSLACCLLLMLDGAPSDAQNEWENPEAGWLREVLPSADSFSVKQGDPPVFFAYRTDSANNNSQLIGYVFTTPDLPPEEVGFSGPIDMLAGMNLHGQITGVRVLHYLESYKYVRGDFINDSNFTSQFIGKSLEDEFRVSRDIDGMSRATITSWAMSRGLHNAAKRIALAYLPGTAYALEATNESTALQSLRVQSWKDYSSNGFVKELAVPIAGEKDLRFDIAYMGHYRLGELLIGDKDYSNADRTASGLIEDGHMLLIGLHGNTPRLQQLRFGAMQNGILYPNQEDRVVFAGTAKDGKIAGQVQFAVALFIDAAIDISQAFTVLYDTGERRGEFANFVGVEYELAPDILTLIGNQSLQKNSDMNRNVVFVVLFLLALILLILNWPRIRATRNKKKKL
ncbi:FMN-binding protein [Gammaproteobacteria bacterium]|nr:FMN-binding protein [Gammaproteobacteria bacterium]